MAEVGAFHSTCEAGELASTGSPWREGKANSSHPEGGNMQETQSSDAMSTSLFRLATLGKQQRICDGVLLRLINKWLKAGVMEAGRVHYPKRSL